MPLFGFVFSALDPVASVGFLGKEAVVGDHDLEIASQMDEIYMMRDGVLNVRNKPYPKQRPRSSKRTPGYSHISV